MTFKLLSKINKSYRNLSLQNIITIPFLLQIFITVGLVGYLSWRNGERAVNNVTSKLRSEVTAGVKQHLENYLETPHLIVQLKQNNIKLQQLTVANFLDLQQDFWSTIQLFNSVRAIYLGNSAGRFIYIRQQDRQNYLEEVTEAPERKTYTLNSVGEKQELLEVDEYDPRQRPWYTKTQLTQGNNWSEIYPFADGKLGITAAGLLQDSQGKTQGIVGVDLVLSGIGDFLRSIEVSENGQVFILERNGYLVATSTDEAPFTYNQDEEKEQRLRAIDSQNFLIKATSQYITEHFHSLHNINSSKQLDLKFKGDRHLVQIVPYQDELGLDWLIAVVIPEADFMAEINANTRNTIWLCLGALAVAIILGIYTSQRIAQPIANLSQVTNLMAQSARAKNTSTKLYPVVEAKSIKELKLLAQSFNEMVLYLKTAFRDLENTNQELENRVKQRTEALVMAKEAADAANRAKSVFLANMSHELRTPLHAILGFTQVALQNSTLQPQQRANLVTVKRSGEHLLTLINDILEVSTIEAGSVSVSEKQFDLHLLLENLVQMFRLRLSTQSRSARLHNKNIELRFDLAPDLPQYIQSDPVKLKQILINLIENGIKFTSKGRVTLKVKPIKNQLAAKSDLKVISFTVEDTGCGISPSELESIFIPFTQTRQFSPQQGTGLGLAISQQFAHLLGGEIKVSSIFGKGSTFEFQIPVILVNRTQFLVNSTTQQSAIYNMTSLPKKERQHQLYTCSKAIDISALASMQSQWIAKLQQAAIEVDADTIMNLIQEIPPDNSALAKALTELTNNYCFDEIVELTEA
ncbi:Multi-sensor signal transduction histidine kinase [Hyella patelloides LEGE 07179]|uniref:histidine kinase n=1 Tax=Hyella patelloides LEGE 07179 TaxID=945734 RepID=A0A563VMP4_9CYAN|nr:hybrid sensor histidine kinase/response regulator [Hyella patelloides]VEP12555.1 Multi-sensor signal transduction histidine kinase [Hyella patelloides LEGE 07179]